MNEEEMGMEIDVERLRTDASRVLHLLEQYPQRDENIWLKRLPTGSCSIVSFTLGQYLLQRYAEDWHLISHHASIDHVTGKRAQYSHTWLSLDERGRGVTVDATVHQFPELGLDGPYIGPSPSPFFERFVDPDNAPVAAPVRDIGSWWHHGQTFEVYEWVFPQLGIEWRPPLPQGKA